MRMIRLHDVEAKVGLKRSTIYALCKQGDFPQPIKLGARASAWVEGAIDEWIEKRVANSVTRLAA